MKTAHCSIVLAATLAMGQLGAHSIEDYKNLVVLLNNQEMAWLQLLKQDVKGRVHLIEQHAREWTQLQLDMLTTISNSDKRDLERIFQELITRALVLRKKHMYEWSVYKGGHAQKAQAIQETHHQQIADFEQAIHR